MKKIKKPVTCTNSLKISNFFTKQEQGNNGASTSLNQVSPIERKRKNDDPHSAGCSKRSNITSNLEENVTPTKSRIAVKTPEKLLTPEALLALNRTPAKAVTPRSLFRDDFVSPSTTPSKPLLNLTPTKRTPNTSSSKNTNTRSKVTPNKNKHSPKKLFQKSPKNLHEFNVEVISDFIKITPSKCMKKTEEGDCVIINSAEKRQASILRYMSPQPSESAKKSQLKNEMTPTKETVSPVLVFGKAKTKIDFSDNRNGNIKEIPAEAKENSPNLSNVDYNFDDDDWDLNDVLIDAVYTLDLSESQYCKIVGITETKNVLVLNIKSVNTGEYGTCNLEGFWSHSMLKVNDTIRIKAEKNTNGHWFVNSESGYLIYEPDVLLSTTSIVNALFCRRKTILVDKFRTSSSGNKFMLVGTLVHSIFQTALKLKINKENKIKEIAKNLIHSKSMLKGLYECDVKIKDIESEVIDFVPKIAKFIDGYLLDNNSSELKQIKDNWKGTIRSIDDIEENIWCPQLGMKGKIDVSIKTNANTIKPLELKTGRATVSLEHRGQVIMYIMMLNQLGIQVPSGLLLYLKDGILREIPVTENEKRDLIMLRNELTFYLTSQPSVLKNNDDVVCIKPVELPEPINTPFCDKCEYNTECVAFLKYNKQESNKNLRKIQEDNLAHVSESHLEYFMLWTSLLALEANSQDERRHVRNIYTLLPEDREQNGTCIANLRVTKVEEAPNDLYEHTFRRNEENSSRNFLFSSIIKNKYVVVSTSKRPAVSAGFVTEISPDEISIMLDRNVLQKHSMNLFHVDMYDSNTIQNFNQSNLTLLLKQSERADELRQIIIEKRLPTFKTKLSKIIVTKGAGILKRLNKVQQRAVLKALAAKDYLLIKGMPGTGKTETIVALIQLLESLGKTVLLTSHTHTAVDNVCLRLIKYGVKLMRLGSNTRIDAELKPYSEHTLTEHCTTTEELELVYKTPNVLAVTCLGANHPILSKRTMDVCIVDESTQVLQCSVLRTLFAAKTFILIGDPNQLPAVVRNKTAIEMGMSESLFDRLNKEEATIALNLNYRMNDPITNLANVLTYNGELLVANEVVAKANIKLPNYESFIKEYEGQGWILNVLNTDLDSAVCFLNTGPVWKMEHSVQWLLSNNIQKSEEFQSQKCVNIYEAALVYSIVSALIKGGVNCDEIGVITTYRAQVAQIGFLLNSVGVGVSTVDQYQGKDKNVIIYSCVKSEDISKGRDTTYDLLSDKRRLNVAITRAKHKLILVGDVSTLYQYSTFSKIISTLETNTITLEEDKNGFDWNKVLDIKTEL